MDTIRDVEPDSRRVLPQHVKHALDHMRGNLGERITLMVRRRHGADPPQNDARPVPDFPTAATRCLVPPPRVPRQR